MPRNQARRDQIRDAAIEVMAHQGAKGLTHRAVDHEAGIPEGTAKNYFASYEDLLQATAERCVERYQDDLRRIPVVGVDGREGLARLLREMFHLAITESRSRVLTYLELHAEAARHPRVQQSLAKLSEADLALHRGVLQAAGLPVNEGQAAVFALAAASALTYRLVHPPTLWRAYGLDDLDAFVANLIETIWPEEQTPSE